MTGATSDRQRPGSRRERFCNRNAYHSLVSSRFAVALHILSYLGLKGKVPVTSEEIAGSIGTNPVVVRRLLADLRRAGLVVIQPGPHGGARLTRDSADIALSDVLRAVEPGPILALHANPPNAACPVGRHIEGILSSVFVDAEKAMERVLKRTSLEDLTAGLKRCSGAS